MPTTDFSPCPMSAIACLGYSAVLRTLERSMTADDAQAYRLTLAKQAAGPDLYDALAQIARLMRESDPRLVDLPLVAAEIAEKSMNNIRPTWG